MCIRQGYDCYDSLTRMERGSCHSLLMKIKGINLPRSNVPIYTYRLFSLDLEDRFCLDDFSCRESLQTSEESFCCRKLQFKSDPSSTCENVSICNSLSGE